MRIAWFSAGVSSAVALKLAMPVDKAIYTHIEDQHPDTMRFVKDVGEWCGIEVEIIYPDVPDVETACLSAGGDGFINGPHGAACTRRLKRLRRVAWEKENPGHHTYIWGLDADEGKRIDRQLQAMPDYDHEFPLVDKGITKKAAHMMLKASGVKRPAMYDLGYPNNNCIGCVKGGMGYWNKIRHDFPEVFQARMELEEKVGATCGKKPLKDLEEWEGRKDKIIVDECGLMCEFIGL